MNTLKVDYETMRTRGRRLTNLYTNGHYASDPSLRPEPAFAIFFVSTPELLGEPSFLSRDRFRYITRRQGEAKSVRATGRNDD